MITKRLSRLLVVALVALSTQAQAATITGTPFKISTQGRAIVHDAEKRPLLYFRNSKFRPLREPGDSRHEMGDIEPRRHHPCRRLPPGHFHYVGIYFDSGPVTTEPNSFGQLCGNTLQSLSYQIELPSSTLLNLVEKSPLLSASPFFWPGTANTTKDKGNFARLKM